MDGKRYIHGKSNCKKASMYRLLLVEVDFNTRSVSRYRDVHFLIIKEKLLIALRLFVPGNRIPT